MKGLTTAEAHAKTEAKMCKNGNSTESSATLTNIRGKKQTRKLKNMVNISFVRRISSRRWADCAAFKAALMAFLVLDESPFLDFVALGTAADACEAACC